MAAGNDVGESALWKRTGAGNPRRPSPCASNPPFYASPVKGYCTNSPRSFSGALSSVDRVKPFLIRADRHSTVRYGLLFRIAISFTSPSQPRAAAIRTFAQPVISSRGGCAQPPKEDRQLPCHRNDRLLRQSGASQDAPIERLRHGISLFPHPSASMRRLRSLRCPTGGSVPGPPAPALMDHRANPR